MTYLVTGATGFLGRHLLQSLTRNRDGRRIVVLVRNRQEWDNYVWAQDLTDVEVLEGTVTDVTAWQGNPCLQDLQGIFHLAALVRHSRRDSEELFRVNIDGTRAMVQLAADKKCRVVFVSTSGTVGCYRDARARADEEAPYCEAEVRGWPYYKSKIRAEQNARRLAESLDVELVIVRPPVLLGPGDHRFRSTGQVVRFLRGRLPFLVRGGIHYVDIRDAAAALVAAMQHPHPKAVYHLHGTACSIDNFFNELGDIAGKKAPRLHLPIPVAWGLAKADEWLGLRLRGKPLALLPDPVVIEMASRYWDVGSRYAEEDLNFHCREGRKTLEDTVQWLKEQGIGN